MRPLVVLILVLGAVAALVFALTSVLGEREPGYATPPVTAAKAPAPAAAQVIDEPEVESARVAEVVDETRQAVQPMGDVRGAFGGILEGLVVDLEGQPIAEARVSLVNQKPQPLGQDFYLMRNQEPPRPVDKHVTDATGTFRFERLDPKKDWTLVVRHDRYMPQEAGPIPIPEDGVRQETIKLELGVTCGGVVRDATSGRPIADALLVIESPFNSFVSAAKRAGQEKKQAKTDATGSYTFYNVSPGQNILVVSAAGYATQVHYNFSLVTLGQAPTRFKNRQPEAGIESKQQDFDLEPGHVIAGRVLGPDRLGVSGVEVTAMNQSGTVGSRGTALSLNGGEFLIEGLSEGLYALQADAEGYESGGLQRVESGETNAVIELFEMGGVQGRVVDPDGRPLESFACKARTTNPTSNVFGAIVAQRKFNNVANGAFELAAVPEGEYVIEANAQGYAPSFSEPFTTVQGVTTPDVVVRMSKGGGLTGMVVDSYSGAPIAGAEVATQDNNYADSELFDLFNALEPTALTKTSVRTDDEGRFAVELMTPGEYQLRVSMRGYTTLIVNDVVVTDGKRADVGAQALSRGALVIGKVHGPDGRPEPGAVVQLYSVDNTQIYSSKKTRSDASGSFQLENVQAGTYKLAASRSGQNAASPFSGIVDLHNSEIEITVEDGAEYEFPLFVGNVREPR